ncbi:MAG: tRNA preQ1(34) S-adenosylmethionine ribosyltransferase-isomerase QueA [Leptolyngbya sp. SIO4C1]|nr:tRNA preQ1(34) S-adenosylmethionine ribosyltransferase-isomerase QueA [Leptolyngbya sp. SIO4C1]
MEQSNQDHLLAAYQYHLPPALIAQNPVVPRDSARLLVVDSPSSYQHFYFRDLPSLLRSGDLLILNDTQVIPARLYGTKRSGARVEVLLLEPRSDGCWLALVKPGRRLRPGSVIEFGAETGSPRLLAEVKACDRATGGRLIQFQAPGGEPFEQLLSELGEMPLPPYITESTAEPSQYQTVYAQRPGAVAAPTAGLHFTANLFQQLAQRNIQTACVTLHVGLGTFRPVEATDITAHQMHAEWVEISQETVDLIQQTQASGGRVIAVGTTTVRTLEGVATQNGLGAYCGPINLFIYPGYRWKVVDGLITNFHLPGSSLLMLVSALTGRERLMQLYTEAVQQTYRFYSFGDAMLVLPEAVVK